MVFVEIQKISCANPPLCKKKFSDMLFLMSHGGIFHRGSNLAKSQKSVPHHLCASATMSLKQYFNGPIAIFSYSNPARDQLWDFLQRCLHSEYNCLTFMSCKERSSLSSKNSKVNCYINVLTLTFDISLALYLQSWTFAYIRLLNNPYVNEVTLREQNQPLKMLQAC